MIKKYITKAFNERITRRNEAVGPTPGRFRAGNCGYISPDGEISIGCHRKAIARCLGITRDSKEVNPYFEVGFANETYIASLLPAKTEDYDYILYDAPGALRITWGEVEISGTPDVQFFKDNQLVAGGELKAHSSGRALEAPFINGKPKYSQVIQAALYSMMSGVPFYLFNKAFTKPAYLKKGQTFKESEKEFKVFIENEKIMYQNEALEIIDTGLREEGIKDFYLLCHELINKKQLYRTPYDPDLPYKHEDYCTECKIADKVNGNFEEWVADVKKYYENS